MIIRRRHTANFTTIGNVLFNDERLRADELGVLAFLLSRPDDWEVRRPQLAKRFDIGRESIKRIVHNCMCAGWIVAKKTRLTNGSFHTIYEVRDEPGPTLTPEQVKDVLSLVSSEATDADEGEEDRIGDHPPDSGPPPTGEPGTAGQGRQTRRGSSKEELLNTDSVNPESPKSACIFADVQRDWPTEHILSSVTAEAVFVALNDSDQANCYRGLKPYLQDCKNVNRKVCDLTTFIRERRWERFVKQGGVSNEVWTAKPYSPHWYRWREYRLAAGESISLMEEWAKIGRGWPTRAEWPPPMPAKTEVA